LCYIKYITVFFKYVELFFVYWVVELFFVDKKITQVYFIDDHPLIILGLKRYFELNYQNLQLVGSSLKVKVALQEIAVLRPNIIVLDLYLGKSDPMLNITLLKNTFPDIALVIFSAEESVIWQARMLEEGIRGYITKTEQPESIADALIHVAHGNISFPDNVLLFFNNKHLISENQLLNAYEREIVHMLTLGSDINQIANSLGKCRCNIDKTLYVLRDRFNVKTNNELIYKLTSSGEIA
jgi:DNA-binding NarL/FixJ family response regulator